MVYDGGPHTQPMGDYDMGIVIRKRHEGLRIRMGSERVFARYEKIACTAARAVARKCNRTHQEMAEEAISHLGEMAADWGNRRVFDPNRGAKPVTWIYSKIYYHLLNMCFHKHRKREVGLPANPVLEARVSWVERVTREMSDEAKALVCIVVEAPEQLMKEFRREPIHARLCLLKHLQQEQGWADEKIDAVWTEVQECL